ncbi:MULTISPECIES: DUF5990 family protein [Pseudofrankia]|uniref:DUF5990 family protein n=1 Tax=Pseudofrankia TaxID=2994363 RepID=UPI000234C55C|nr:MULTISPECIES: DUF5990 family protein [Pseudofrankia]OHV31023.1 monooxygenase [Pseudofrankia sp. EUN1h]
MLIRVEGSDLPGRACAGGPGFPGYTNIHVAVQPRGRPTELLGLVPGDAATAVWTLECTTSTTPATTTPGGIDLRGQHIQGRPGERFIYLTWGVVDPAEGGFAMFRRAKLWLNAMPADVLTAAVVSNLLVGRLGLTDAKGHPLCASVRPPTITWTAETA